MKITEQDISEDIYNLLLNPFLSAEERKILLDVKNELGVSSKNNDRVFMNLNHSIRQLAVLNISKHQKLTPEFANFYQKLSQYCEKQGNLARGFVAFGLNFR